MEARSPARNCFSALAINSALAPRKAGIAPGFLPPGPWQAKQLRAMFAADSGLIAAGPVAQTVANIRNMPNAVTGIIVVVIFNKAALLFKPGDNHQMLSSANVAMA